MLEHKRRLLAVCVGIDSYADPSIPNLRYACEDAKSFYECLERTFQPSDTNLTLLLDEDATLQALRTAIGERLARISEPNDIILLFFAGHGSPETSKKVDKTSRYLVLHDTQYDNIFATGLDLERDLERLLERIPSKHIVVFLDACFSGRAGGRTFEGPRIKWFRSELRLAQPLVNLKELELGEGRFIISACDDWQVAREDSKLGHGIFTHCLLQSIKKKSAEDPTISLFELYDNVARCVASMTEGQQFPIIIGRGRLTELPLFNPDNKENDQQ